MKFWPALVFFMLLRVGGADGNDKIQSLFETLKHQPSVFPWDNGYYSPIKLPAQATPKRVILPALRINCLLGTQQPTAIHRYNIVAVEKAIMPSPFPGRSKYTAVLIRTDRGEKIIMMRHGNDGWWTRVYSVEAHGKSYTFDM